MVVVRELTNGSLSVRHRIHCVSKEKICGTGVQAKKQKFSGSHNTKASRTSFVTLANT